MPSIIIIHDSETLRDLLCLLLSLEGYTVTGCSTTAAAPLIRHASPDLLILDIPPHHASSGWTVRDSLRTDPTTATTPVLVCSTTPAILADVQQRGLPTFSAPCDPLDLLALVAAQLQAVRLPADPGSEHLLSHNGTLCAPCRTCCTRHVAPVCYHPRRTGAHETRARRYAPAHPPKEPRMSPPLIMIINDDPRILTLFTLLLEDAGYRTITHRHGAGAPALITQTQPALVILDIFMERPDAGWQVLDDLRRDPATQRLPVLIYSGQRDVAERVQERGDPRCGLLPIDTGLDGLLLRVGQWLLIGG